MIIVFVLQTLWASFENIFDSQLVVNFRHKFQIIYGIERHLQIITQLDNVLARYYWGTLFQMFRVVLNSIVLGDP